MPQDRTTRTERLDTTWGSEGYIGPPEDALRPVQSKTPSMLRQEFAATMSARSGLNPAGSTLPRGEGLPPTQGPVQSTRPLIHAGEPFTPGMRPNPIDPDIRSRNRNPNTSGIIVPRPDL